MTWLGMIFARRAPVDRARQALDAALTDLAETRADLEAALAEPDFLGAFLKQPPKKPKERGT